MVERGADVIGMDGKPVKQSAFLRADAAIRRMPGLGVLIAMVLLENTYRSGNWIGFAWLVIGITAALFMEFIPRPAGELTGVPHP